MADMFLIEKNGWYYRPDASGYTGEKSEAGRYSFEEAAERVGPNGPDGPQDGLSMWREAEAPAFSSGCPWDVKLLAPYKARIAELEAALSDFAATDFTDATKGWPRHPDDEEPLPLTDAQTVWDMQKEAKELLEGDK